MARSQRDRRAWNQYIHDEDDFINERRSILAPPAGRDIEHWGYGYGAF